MYQRQGKAAYKADLSNTLKLMQGLNHPESKFKSIHIAGTNGKGSTSHLIASALQSAGYRVGLYTSPHLLDFRERIRINGEMISEAYVVNFVESHKAFFESIGLSFFEMTVGLAFDYFSNQAIDIAVVEVGMGGRLDSTNVLEPELSVITNIGLDHTQFLGNTLERIAGEKGGIIKKNTPVVIGEYQEETYPVFKSLAQQNHAQVINAFSQNTPFLSSDLKGSYQKHNLKTAYTVLKCLESGICSSQFEYNRINDLLIFDGFSKVQKQTGLMGRWQILSDQPLTIADTAHNKEGLCHTLDQVAESLSPNGQAHFVLGMVSDKDLDQIVGLFPKDANYYISQASIARALPKEDLFEAFKALFEHVAIFDDLHQALFQAQNSAKAQDLIYIGGSTFTVAEILEKF